MVSSGAGNTPRGRGGPFLIPRDALPRKWILPESYGAALGHRFRTATEASAHLPAAGFYANDIKLS